MKWKHLGQQVLLSGAAAALGLGLISCGQSNTIDYLYATSAKNNPGQINIYRVDSQSGALMQIADSPFPTQQRNPVSLAADAVGSNIYVAFEDDNAIVQYGIGTDAKLYAQNTVNPSGTQPIAVTVHSYYACEGTVSTNSYCNLGDGNGTYLGSLLFVLETYQPNYTTLNPGPGALYVYNLGTSGALSSTPVTQTVNGVSQSYYPVEMSPTAVAASADGGKVYVTDILQQAGTGSGCVAGQGGVEAFTLTASSNGMPSGVLSPVSGSPYCAGTTPSAVASDQFSANLYVTDSTQNQVIQYRMNTTGQLTPLPTAVVAAGTGPDGITVDPYNQYVYVSNYIGGTVSAYALNQASGALSALASSSIGTGTQPGCIIVEPALAKFVYTANNNGNSVSGFVLDRNTGALSATQGTFYNTSGLSRCVAAVSHGNHPIIHVQNTAGS